MTNDKRLIYANELLRYVGSKLGFMISKRELLQAVEMQPTVDAAEVVPCEHCKHYKWDDFTKTYVCPRISRYVTPDFWCKYGVRRLGK